MSSLPTEAIFTVQQDATSCDGTLNAIDDTDKESEVTLDMPWVVLERGGEIVPSRFRSASPNSHLMFSLLRACDLASFGASMVGATSGRMLVAMR